MAEEKGGVSPVHTEIRRHAKSLGGTNKGIIGIVLVLNSWINLRYRLGPSL